MKNLFHCSAFLCALLVTFASNAQDAPRSPLAGVKFIHGPTKGVMQDIAQIDVPKGYIFTDREGTQKAMQGMGNLLTDQEVGMVAPTNLNWFAVFEFEDVGYVKDDEKDKLDADDMMKKMKSGDAPANKERAQMGIPALHTVGWEKPPHYNTETHNLEWCLRLESGGEFVLNHNIRLLGRKGVMRVTVVADPAGMQAAMTSFNSLLAGYSYQTGQSYAEYKQGDKMAKYGLAALVVGGAAVGAAKLGLFASLMVFLKKGWKLVVFGVAAVAVAVKKLFGRVTGRGDSSQAT